MTRLTTARRGVLVAVMLLACGSSVGAIAQSAASPPPGGAQPPGQSANPPPGGAQLPGQSPNPPPGGGKPRADLKTSVTILGATGANDAVSTAIPSGTTVPLTLYVKEPPAEHADAVLRVSRFTSQAQPTVVASAKIQLIGSSAAAAESAAIKLGKIGEVPIELQFDQLRAATTYIGQLFITARDLVYQWPITVVTAAHGVLAVDPLNTIRFTLLPPFRSFGETGSFSITLRDKSDGGPYTQVLARFLPPVPAGAQSQSLATNVTIDTFSFTREDVKVDLTQRGDRASSAVTASAPTDAKTSTVEPKKSQADGKSQPDDRELRTVRKAQAFKIHLAPLSPGEYVGALQFSANETADDAADAKLPFVIQVRHHWLLPLLVIVLGSVVGWFTSKYVVGARKARDLSRQAKDLGARVEFLARPSGRGGWAFSSESGSLGYTRVAVSLNRLARMAASAMEVLFHGDELDLLKQQIEQRLAALESLAVARRQVEPVCDGRPAAQKAVGRLLRAATNLVDQPTFATTEQAALTKLLEAVQAWANAATFAAAYQQAVLDRLRSNEIPDLAAVKAVDGPVGAELLRLFNLLPADAAVVAPVSPADLKDSDQKIARLALLWRERGELWAEDLATKSAAGKSLSDLFDAVDHGFWSKLRGMDAAKSFAVVLVSPNQGVFQTQQIVEMNLVPSGVERGRVLFHPLRVRWRIHATGDEARTTETDGLTLVQYFRSAGKVSVQATLSWASEEIPIPQPLEFAVAQNPDYRQRWVFSREWPEWVAIGGAALFAMATAMSTMYGPTFGTYTQYLGLFVWAAGAGTGGNVFSQLGTTSAAGGRTDAALSKN